MATRADIAARERLGFVAVAMIGYSAPLWESPGDNRGIWPCFFSATEKPADAARQARRYNPHQGRSSDIVLHAYVWTASRFHATRLKDRLEALAHGDAVEDRELEGMWFDCSAGPELVWGIYLQDALADIRDQEHFEVYDLSDMAQAVEREKRRGRL